MSETPLQAATRWKEFWARGMDSYGHMCADALSEEDLEHARKFAARFDQCRRRFWAALTHEALVAEKHEAPPTSIRWFGELVESDGLSTEKP